MDANRAHHPRWRYAHRVRAGAAAFLGVDNELPLLFAEKFLEDFGNDFRMWYSMRRYAPPNAPWLPKLLARLAGEVALLPHEWMAWASLASALKTPDPTPSPNSTPAPKRNLR